MNSIRYIKLIKVFGKVVIYLIGLYVLTCFMSESGSKSSFKDNSVRLEDTIKNVSLKKDKDGLHIMLPKDIYERNPSLNIQGSEDDSKYYLYFYNINDKQTCEDIKKAGDNLDPYFFGGYIKQKSLVDNNVVVNINDFKTLKDFNCDIISGLFFSVSKR